MAQGQFKVVFDGGVIVLSGGKWSPGEPPTPLSFRAAAIANEMTNLYRYSPAHGYPGYQLTAMVARKLDGKAECPPHPPLPEGADA